MREILFRGKRLDNSEWAYGCYSVGAAAEEDKLAHMIQRCRLDSTGEAIVEIDPQTLGQFTGRTDKNGKKIFEGDILSFGEETYYVAWDNDDCGYCKISIDGGTPIQESFDWFYSGHSEILGNIHDNPELLEAQDEAF